MKWIEMKKKKQKRNESLLPLSLYHLQIPTDTMMSELSICIVCRKYCLSQVSIEYVAKVIHLPFNEDRCALPSLWVCVECAQVRARLKSLMIY